MLRALRSRYVHLSIASLKVFSMESHHRMCVVTLALNSFSLPPCSQFSAQIHTRSSALSSSTLLERFSHRSLSNTHDTSPSSSLDWARNFSTRRGQSSEGTELQGRGPAVVEVPCAPGQRVCSFVLSDIHDFQLHLISLRETLVRGRSGKDYCP
jgi:hypothetical protein